MKINPNKPACSLLAKKNSKICIFDKNPLIAKTFRPINAPKKIEAVNSAVSAKDETWTARYNL